MAASDDWKLEENDEAVLAVSLIFHSYISSLPIRSFLYLHFPLYLLFPLFPLPNHDPIYSACYMLTAHTHTHLHDVRTLTVYVVQESDAADARLASEESLSRSSFRGDSMESSNPELLPHKQPNAKSASIPTSFPSNFSTVR